MKGKFAFYEYSPASRHGYMAGTCKRADEKSCCHNVRGIALQVKNIYLLMKESSP